MEEGEAVKILIPREDHCFELNRAALERILLQENVKNRKVVVISVAGSFRKGKSFLLSFFLRYLNAKDSEDWMGKPDEPLTGFNWKASRDRVTTGIFMWSKPFLTKLPSGDQVAILLMDTQGIFDGQSTEKENSVILALSTMLSSVLIYNVSQNLYESDLLHLQRFAEYGKLALDTSIVPFQNLIFLVRDYPMARDWGAAGGKSLLEERMQVKSKELQIVRDLINSSFSERSCYLMPYPGKAVASKEDFTGQLLDIEEDFRKYLKIFISSVLEPSNLVVKNISGNDVSAKNFIQYFHKYVEIFLSDAVPKPQNILLGVIECDNVVALTNVKEVYLKTMDKLRESTSPDDINDEQKRKKLKESHEEIKAEALKLFDTIKKTGGPKHSKKYRDQLIKCMDDQYADLTKVLRNKKALKTLVDEIQAKFREAMEESYGMNTVPSDQAEMEKFFVVQVGVGQEEFFERAFALEGAENLIEVYKQELDRAMLHTNEFYIKQNSEKNMMSEMVNKILQDFKSKMQKQYEELSHSVNIFEFLQTHVQMRNEALAGFDSIKCSQQIIAFFKPKLEKELYTVVTEYEKIYNQKLHCNQLIEYVLLEYKDGWKNKQENMQKARLKLKAMIADNSSSTIHLLKLVEKLENKWLLEECLSSAKTVYEKSVEEMINRNASKVTVEKADKHHEISKSKAKSSFEDATKNLKRDEEYFAYRKQLETELDFQYNYYKGLNDCKSGCVIS